MSDAAEPTKPSRLERSFDIARRLWEATSEGDRGEILEIYSSDVVWRSRGSNPFSSEVHGSRALLEYLASVGEAVDEMSSELHEIYANEDGAVLHFTTRARAGERSLRCDFFLRLSIAGDRVDEVELVALDPKQNDGFWQSL